jgi:hypothetical protein
MFGTEEFIFEGFFFPLALEGVLVVDCRADHLPSKGLSIT